MITGITTSGFEYEVEDEVLDNYELLDALHNLEKGDYGYITEVAHYLLGKSQVEALKEYLRNENGRVSAKAMMKVIEEVLKNKDLKK